MIRLFTFFILYSLLSFYLLYSQTEQAVPDSLTETEIEWLTGPINTDDRNSPILDGFERNFFHREHPELALNIRSRFTDEIQERQAYANGTYLGSSLKSYQRIRAAQKNYSGGILLKKDAGEQNLDDFTTGFIQAKNIFDSVSVLFGDYVVEQGQGLSLWQGFELEKGSDVSLPAHRSAHGIVPHLTSDEAHYFSGGAAEFRKMQFALSLFYSQRNLAGTPDPLTNNISLYNEEYFRTSNEAAKRNRLAEATIGAAASYQLVENISIGASWYDSRYNHTVVSGVVGQNFLTEFAIGSISFEAVSRSLKMYGEFAGEKANATGEVLGMEFSTIGNLRFIALLRRYDELFYSPHGLGFGEGNETNNETGAYIGFSYIPEKYKKISGYLDLFSFPSPSLSTIYSVQGNDELLRYEFRQTEQLSLSLQARRIQTLYSISTGSALDTEKTKYQFRITSDMAFPGGFSLRNRFEYVALSDPFNATENGFLFYADVGAAIMENVSGNIRVAYFHTDSFNSRVAEFEKDVDGLLNIPALFGEGFRSYIFFDYTILRNLKAQAKFSTLYRSDVPVIGTGINQFLTNYVNTVSVQLEWER